MLVGASIVLALGWRGGSSVVGPSRWGRVALVASGSGDLLLVLAVAVAFISGAANAPWLDPALVAGQAVIFVATAGAATIMRRSGSLTGAARWAFLALAAVDAVGVTLGLASGASLVFLMVVVVARPVVVLVAGTALLLHRRTAEQ